MEMQSPKQITGTGIALWTGSVRLPPGEYFQVIHFGAGTIRYRYGNVTSPPLYAAVTGAGPIMLHPGGEVFIELAQTIDTVAFIHMRGSIPDTNLPGWKQ